MFAVPAPNRCALTAGSAHGSTTPASTTTSARVRLAREHVDRSPACGEVGDHLRASPLAGRRSRPPRRRRDRRRRRRARRSAAAARRRPPARPAGRRPASSRPRLPRGFVFSVEGALRRPARCLVRWARCRARSRSSSGIGQHRLLERQRAAGDDEVRTSTRRRPTLRSPVRARRGRRGRARWPGRRRARPRSRPRSSSRRGPRPGLRPPRRLGLDVGCRPRLEHIRNPEREAVDDDARARGRRRRRRAAGAAAPRPSPGRRALGSVPLDPLRHLGVPRLARRDEDDRRGRAAGEVEREPRLAAPRAAEEDGQRHAVDLAGARPGIPPTAHERSDSTTASAAFSATDSTVARAGSAGASTDGSRPTRVGARREAATSRRAPRGSERARCRPPRPLLRRRRAGSGGGPRRGAGATGAARRRRRAARARRRGAASPGRRPAGRHARRGRSRPVAPSGL